MLSSQNQPLPGSPCHWYLPTVWDREVLGPSDKETAVRLTSARHRRLLLGVFVAHGPAHTVPSVRLEGPAVCRPGLLGGVL